MSTYQYYEFKAVDRPLTSAQQAELRKLSSRAKISATRFVNFYNYGDFRGDPDRLMERYFDAFVYVASWGSRELQFRLPRRLFDPALAQPYLREDFVSLRTKGEHVILKFRVDQDDADWEEGEGWLDELLPLREALLAGDLRALYIGWLAGASGSGDENEDMDEEDEGDEELEPPVPPGLGARSEALNALANFLFVPQDVIAASAKANPAPFSESVPKQALAQWLSTLPTSEKDSLLLRVIEGSEPLLGAELLHRFRAAHPREQVAQGSGARRTVGQLRAEAAAHEVEREKSEARRAARARARELAALAARESEVWREVDSLFSTRSPNDHTRGVQLLVDLRDLAQHRGTLADFQRRFADIRDRNARRQGLMRRMNEAGLGLS
ncbi:hypothetical protein JQX13_21290 [Archangium violaceum]|uniref:hypothetical protein n=1 Tax=Archangium violaceum TaxID=83451 RepID=UPI00193B5988|nr:hypothetical protein [Archangium violaceum]QRK12334.1 hypothetical protein JQX13_21290 [Archangium violaceum]